MPKVVWMYAANWKESASNVAEGFTDNVLPVGRSEVTRWTKDGRDIGRVWLAEGRRAPKKGDLLFFYATPKWVGPSAGVFAKATIQRAVLGRAPTAPFATELDFLRPAGLRPLVQRASLWRGRGEPAPQGAFWVKARLGPEGHPLVVRRAGCCGAACAIDPEPCWRGPVFCRRASAGSRRGRQVRCGFSRGRPASHDASSCRASRPAAVSGRVDERVRRPMRDIRLSGRAGAGGGAYRRLPGSADKSRYKRPASSRGPAHPVRRWPDDDRFEEAQRHRWG